MRIYTKTGDAGTAELFNGQRLPKDCDFFAALGDVDELNCAVGVAREFCEEAGETSVSGQVRPGSALPRRMWRGGGRGLCAHRAARFVGSGPRLRRAQRAVRRQQDPNVVIGCIRLERGGSWVRPAAPPPV